VTAKATIFWLTKLSDIGESIKQSQAVGFFDAFARRVPN
jgi:hypothetical protein